MVYYLIQSNLRPPGKNGVRMLPLVFHSSQYLFRPITVPVPFSRTLNLCGIRDCVYIVSISDITSLLFHINFSFHRCWPACILNLLFLAHGSPSPSGRSTIWNKPVSGKSYSLSLFFLWPSIRQLHLFYSRNRKHTPCFYGVTERQVEVLESEKC